MSSLSKHLIPRTHASIVGRKFSANVRSADCQLVSMMLPTTDCDFFGRTKSCVHAIKLLLAVSRTADCSSVSTDFGRQKCDDQDWACSVKKKHTKSRPEHDITSAVGCWPTKFACSLEHISTNTTTLDKRRPIIVACVQGIIEQADVRS